MLLHLFVGALTIAWHPSCLLMTTTSSTRCSKACTLALTALGIALGAHLVISFGPLFMSLMSLMILQIPFLGVCLLSALSIVAMSVALVLLGLSAYLGVRLSTCLTDAGTLQEVLLQLLPQHGNHVHAFTTYEVAPVMSDHDVVQEHAVILDDIGTNRATGYAGFVTTFCLFPSKDGMSDRV